MAKKRVVDLPLASGVNSTDVLHLVQTLTDVQATMDQIAKFVLRQSNYKMNWVQVDANYTVDITYAQDLLITLGTGSGDVTITLPAIPDDTKYPMRVTIIGDSASRNVYVSYNSGTTDQIGPWAGTTTSTPCEIYEMVKRPNSTPVRGWRRVFGPLNLMAKLLTVDGAGSGLDSDFIDGVDSTQIPYGTGSKASTTITDANTPTKSGFYSLDTPFTNAPDTNSYSILHTQHQQGDNNNAFQVAKRDDEAANGSWYIRTKNAGTWTSWSKIWNAANMGLGSGLANDTVAVLTTANTSSGNSTKWTKVATITLGSVSDECCFGLELVSSGDSNSGFDQGRMVVRARQQASFGSNPIVSMRTRMVSQNNILAFGYVIVQNTPSSIIDVYVQINSTNRQYQAYATDVLNSSKVSFLSSQAFVTTPGGLVTGTLDPVQGYNGQIGSGTDVLATIKTQAQSGTWTSASGATNTPEGSGGAVWFYSYMGDASYGTVFAWKNGVVSDVYVNTLNNGTWGTWFHSATPPIGAVVIQGPGDTAPGTLYPNTTWSNVSAEEAGVVRRAEGGLAAAFFTGTPATFSVSVSGGVPTITIVAGGTGYLSGGSGTINLVVSGGCTTQMVATATVTSGVLTAINVTTPGAGYVSGAVGVYDGVSKIGDKFMAHWHGLNGAPRPSNNTGTGATVTEGAAAASSWNVPQATAPITTGADGTPRSGPETTGAYATARKWRRTA